jgi:hypothetical protein
MITTKGLIETRLRQVRLAQRSAIPIKRDYTRERIRWLGSAVTKDGTSQP